MKKILYILLFLPLFAIAQEQDPCFSVNDFISYTEEANPTITKNFVGGWNMFGFPCSQEIDVVDAFSSIIDKVLIVKSNNGSVYMPEFGFNGIGFLEGGEGYQIKMANTEYGFSFCEPITWANLEGCSDCEATNFNQWANVDDGSCNYDSDGDGIDDIDEIVGCPDSTACSYNELATDEGECTYATDGYDCEGNQLLEIGALMHGGIVFYIDGTGEHGLVAALEDITEGSNMGSYGTDAPGTDEGFEWGCNGSFISGADGTGIGTGYQNTLDILAQNCQTENGGITAAQAAFNYTSEGYTDWFLPSLYELDEIFNTIGGGGSQVNIGGFDTSNHYNYRSSSEYGFNGFSSWSLGFYNGNTHLDSKTKSRRVRAVRAF